MKALWQEFKKFISRGNVVDMAIGVAVATAFTKIVTAFTNGFVAPLLALFTNNADLGEFKWVLRQESADQAEVAILWGAFLQTVIDFLIIALILFLVLKIFTSATRRAEKMRADLIKDLNPEAARKAKEEAAKAEAEAKAAKAAEEEAQKQKAEEEKALRAAVLAQAEAAANSEKVLSEILATLKKQ